MSKELHEMTVEELDAECDALTKAEEAIVTILALKPGQTVSAEQVASIQFFEDYTRRNEDTAIETFHRGYERGMEHAAGAEAAKLIEERDGFKNKAMTERLLGRFWARDAFIRGAQVCREMMARFVEQGGDVTTAESIRANWRPAWGNDPGRPSDDFYAEAKPIEIRESDESLAA